MIEDQRHYRVSRLLFDYVKSPSLKHIREPFMLQKLAGDIIKQLDRGETPWQKWTGPRERLVAAASECWIPISDLRDHLNSMAGPTLTPTDVAQRLRAHQEEPYSKYPSEQLKKSCEALYAAEKAQGTELPAIIGALQEHVEQECARLVREQAERWQAHKEAERLGLEQRFYSGADCKWTSLNKSKALFCRANGRMFRLTPTPEKVWLLERIETPEGDGGLVGRYRSRRDVTKVLAEVAYKPEPRW